MTTIMSLNLLPTQVTAPGNLREMLYAIRSLLSLLQAKKISRSLVTVCYSGHIIVKNSNSYRNISE
jgi:hypothetical protein